jgi:ElaA protein
MIRIHIKKFNDLSAQELYDVLRLRSEVFVVEQNCVYQDLDGKDMLALHLIGKKEGQVVAYTRLFNQGDYYRDAGSIGRVVVKASERKYGYGQDIMKASINAMDDNFKVSKIRISAQSYLKKFYTSLGFMEQGDEYMEDGIPHIAMVFTMVP